MTSYPFIENLFQTVLSKSKSIQGRFFISTRSGTEINTEDLGQVITDTVGEHTRKRYPLAMMLPPVITGSFSYNNMAPNHEQLYRVTLFFLDTVYYSNGKITNQNSTTGTSQQTIPDVWEKTMQAAMDFFTSLSFLNSGRRRDAMESGFSNTFQLSKESATLQPVAGTVGGDRVSGVRLDFSAVYMAACEELVDYDLAPLNEINFSSLMQGQ